MFSHIVLGSNDLDRSLAFYSAVLAPLGAAVSHDGREEGWLGFGDPSIAPDPLGGKAPSLWICRPIDGRPASFGNGVNVGLAAPDRAAVDRAYQAAMALGAASEGAPGLRPQYSADWHGAYVRDPDGNKLCIVCRRPETSPAP